jgi:hypothetical protein
MSWFDASMNEHSLAKNKLKLKLILRLRTKD